jgi:hypothetical protein
VPALLLSVGPNLLQFPRPVIEECHAAKSTPSVDLKGGAKPFEHGDVPAGTVIDARKARWAGTDPYVVVIRPDAGSGVCLSGGDIQGDWPQDTSWDVMHGTGAVVISSPRATVEDLRVNGYGDSIRFVDQAQDFLVRRVHLSDSRDDCIENDWLHSGTIQDSLLECYNAFSARTYEDQEGVHDGSHNLMRIENSLVRLQPMPRPYNDQGLIPGTAGFFKWDPEGPKLSLQGNVFRADQPASTVGLAIPEDKLADCSGNIMVWLGRGDYPEKLPPCFTVTKDVRVWQAAVQRWEENYGNR